MTQERLAVQGTNQLRPKCIVRAMVRDMSEENQQRISQRSTQDTRF